MEILVNIARAAGDFLLPKSCLLCGEIGDFTVCSGCYEELPWLKSACETCALPLPKAGMCGACQQQPPQFDCCVSPWQFAPPVGKLINQFKHRRNFRYGDFLATELSRTLRQQYQERQQQLPQAVMAVPLHWRRGLWRGFNQSQFLAQEVCRDLGLQWLKALRRNQPTPKQQGANRKQRLKNLDGVFSCEFKGDVPERIALVDDVMTTGATVEAVCTVLKQAGVKSIDIWVLARTPAPK